jgi:hypothetical protein
MYNILCSIYENLHPNVVNVYATERSGGTTPLILNLGIRWGEQLHVPAGLPSGNEPQVLYQGLGGTRRWYGRCGREQFLVSARNRTMIPRTSSP